MARRKSKDSAAQPPTPTELRIIGGDLRGRKLEYHGDPRTRPMKDRVREAVFNLVEARGTYAIDLFAGTGALGLEAISRGAAGAMFIERHFPTAKLISQNAYQLGIQDRCLVLPGSALVWAHRLEAHDVRPSRTPTYGLRDRRTDVPLDVPWLVFCSPPYDFYVSRYGEMLDLIQRLIVLAPAGSTFVVESDERFAPSSLPQAAQWDTRRYLPAVVSIFRKP